MQLLTLVKVQFAGYTTYVTMAMALLMCVIVSIPGMELIVPVS